MLGFTGPIWVRCKYLNVLLFQILLVRFSKESFPNLRLIRKSTFMPETPEFKEKSDYF